MADKKVSELTTLNTASGDDLLLVVNDPSGTPASRKITVNNLFGNVVVSTTHKAPTTFQANTFVRGTVCTVSANVNITAGLSVNSTAILPAIQDRMQVANTTLLVNDRMQVANVNSYIANTNAWLTASNTAIDDRMQVANVQSLFVNTVANTVTIQANTGLVVAVSTAPSSNNPTTEGWTQGTIAFSNTYLYIAVDGNSIKRVPLEVF